MADTVYNIAKARMASGDLDLNADTIRMLLLKTTAAGAYDPDLTSVAAVLAVGSVAECDFTNYVRKDLASLTVTANNTDNRADVDAANVTWTAAGGAANNTPAAALIYEFITNDAGSFPISYHDTNFASVATNGGDYTVTIADFLRLT